MSGFESINADTASHDPGARLTGPFSQLITMDGIPPKGPLEDRQLPVIHNAGILHATGTGSRILEIDDFDVLRRRWPSATVDELPPGSCGFPGLVDCHTHMLWAGSRCADFAARLSGSSYQEIMAAGGGIMRTVSAVRQASEEDLTSKLAMRAAEHLRRGVTSCEVKSGYGLSVESELTMLEVISKASRQNNVPRLIPTCLAAHKNPPDSGMSDRDYLDLMAEQLLPLVLRRGLAARVDIFVEEGAFSPLEAADYLRSAKNQGFSIVIHGDQFSSGGASLAVEMRAVSVDHLEHIEEPDLRRLCESPTTAVALPGASIGLGEPFAPARRLLDGGASLAIASDWNPGSAPNGNLILQASVLGAYEKLTMAELWAGMTSRAAAALELDDRGVLAAGKRADFISFQGDWKEVLWAQGELRPFAVWKDGRRAY